MDRYLGGDSDINKKFSRQFKISVIMLIVVILGLIITIITQRDSIVSWGNDVINFLNTTIEISRMAIIGWILLFVFISIILTIYITTNKFKKTNWYSRYCFKKNKWKEIKRILQDRIIPQLNNKVLSLDRIASIGMENRTNYLDEWGVKYREEFSVNKPFKNTIKVDFAKIQSILDHYPNLKKHIKDTQDALNGYDEIMGHFIKHLIKYGDENNLDKVKLESWIYNIFDIPLEKRRGGDTYFDWDDEIEISDEKLDKILSKLDERTIDAIEKCNNFINLKKSHWKKEKRWFDFLF